MRKLTFLVFTILFYIIGLLTVYLVNNLLQFNFDSNFVIIAPILPAILAGITSHILVKKLLK